MWVQEVVRKNCETVIFLFEGGLRIGWPFVVGLCGPSVFCFFVQSILFQLSIYLMDI